MAQLTTNSQYALDQLQMPEPQGAEVVNVRVTHALTANVSANDVAWLCDLPPGCVIVEAVLESTDIDTNGVPTVTISLGELNAGKTDLDQTYIAASTVGQTGGATRPTLGTMYQRGASSSARSIGLKFPAVSATFAAGTVGVVLSYRAVHGGL